MNQDIELLDYIVTNLQLKEVTDEELILLNYLKRDIENLQLEYTKRSNDETS